MRVARKQVANPDKFAGWRGGTLGGLTVTDGPIADVIGFGALSLAYAGIWMLFLTRPWAVAGAILLRQRRAHRPTLEPD